MNRRKSITIAVLLSFMFVVLIATLAFTYAANRKDSYEPTETEAASGEDGNCDIVVAKDGSGQQKTISAALASVEENQKICVKPGTYFEEIVVKKAGVTLTAFDKKKRPVIDGDKDGSGNGIFELPEGKSTDLGNGRSFNHKELVALMNKNITFSYFIVRNSKGDGIGIYSDKVPLTNIHVHHNLVQYTMVPNFVIEGKYSGNSGSVAGSIIEDNIFEQAGLSNKYGRPTWPGSVCIGGADDLIFRKNIIRHAYGDGILLDCNWKRSKDVLIENNFMYDNKVGMMYIHAADRITVRNNFFFSTLANPTRNAPQWACIMFQAQERQSYGVRGIYGVADTKVYNNILWGCITSLGVSTQAPGSYIRNTDVFNNTFVNNGKGGGLIKTNAKSSDVGIQSQSPQQEGAVESLRVRNNIFAHAYDGVTPVFINGSAKGVTFSNNHWAKKPTNVDASKDFGGGDVMLKGKTGQGDFPIFTKAPTIDEIIEARTWFELKSGSPAINKSLDGFNLKIDYNGYERTAPNDLGALELGTKPIDGWEYINPPGPDPISGECGDGKIDAGEECDDGNKDNTDSCLNDCTKPIIDELCGNGEVDEGEECDDGNDNNEDSCRNNCTKQPEPGSKPTDLNNDNKVDMLDMSLVLAQWEKSVDPTEKVDINSDGMIDMLDVSLLLSDWSN